MAYSNYYAASGLFHGSMSSVMGTQFDILMVGSDPRLLGTVWEKVESEVQRLDKMLNRFDPESEVSFVNREAGHYPVTVGEELWNILLNCKRYNELTEGYFDITLQGFDQVLLTEEDKSIFFFSESLHIDLGGYGKGYALAKIRELLEENGIGKALVNFGNSSVLAVGTHPCGEYWPVGLDNPFTKERIADLKLSDSSLSISGNMPSHPRHIVNPHTGTFVEDKKMVSVVAKEREPTESKNMIRAFATFVMRESKCTKAANGFQAVTDRNFSNTDPTLRQRGVRSASGQRNEWEKFVPEKGTGRTGITEGSNPQWFRADG